MTDLLVAVDVGGTRVRAATVDFDGSVIRKVQAPTAHHEVSPEQLLTLIGSVVEGEQISRVVVGVPGRIDAARGAVVHARNLRPSWLPFLSEEWLTERVGAPVALAGDAQLAAVGETYFGAGSVTGDTAYLTFSTGVGAAALSAGRLLMTRQTGFQLGLIPTAPLAGPVVDDSASGKPIDAFLSHRSHVASAQDLIAMAADGDQKAAEVWKTVTTHAAWVAVVMCHTVCPDVLVVGGGLANAGAALLDPIAEAIKRLGPQGLETPIEIRLARRGDDAGLAGAAAWHVAVSDGKEI